MPIQILQIIKVILVLSTIVAATDCCSSRILLRAAIAEDFLCQLQQLQEQQQLEAAVQEAALEANKDLDPNIDPLRAQSVETSTESSFAFEILSSSTETWSAADSSTPVTSEITTTPSTTVTHTGEPPPDHRTSSSFALKPTTLPSVDEDKRKNATEVLLL